LRRVKTVFLIVLLSLTLVSTYISGPIHGRVTNSHYLAVQKVYQDMLDNHREKYCVLSEHFSLTALEAVSAGKIRQGNFPIKYGYLSESGSLLIKMFSKPDIKWIKEAMSVSQAPGCYLILDSRFLVDWNKTQIRWILGREKIKVDDVYIWRYDEKVKSEKLKVKSL
jgi:hypothetical protein